MSYFLPDRQIRVCVIVACLCVFNGISDGDEFTDGCLFALSEPTCSPFVACGIVEDDCVPCDAVQAVEACRPDCRGIDSSVKSRIRLWYSERRTHRRNDSSIRCRIESKFANWRHGSVYQEGCLPEGYALSHFVRAVPNVEFHSTPLNPSVSHEPGGMQQERTLIEGPDKPSLTAISLDIKPAMGALPEHRAEQAFAAIGRREHLPGTTRLWNATTQYWQASLLNHQPLYFEDVNLERHGFSHGCCQPMISGAKFFTTVAILPYLIGSDPAHCTHYVLGENRPGSHACYVCQRPRLSLKGAACQATAVSGMIFLLP